MRTTHIVITCDQCAWTGTHEEDAPHPVTITITGAGDDTPRAIDCCPVHVVGWRSLVQQLAGTAPVDKPAPPPRVLGRKPGKAPAAKPDYCAVCGANFTRRSGLVVHLRKVHLAGVELPPSPDDCPECGQEFHNPSACGMHRAQRHGFDLVAQLYDDVERQGTRERRRRRGVA